MSTDVITCSLGDGVDRLMSLMTDRRIRHLPVVDDHGHLAGIVSIGDVVKARLTELEHENRGARRLHQRSLNPLRRLPADTGRSGLTRIEAAAIVFAQRAVLSAFGCWHR